jgi:3-phosphoshikimate 1-carboxyvinyltransferase
MQNLKMVEIKETMTRSSFMNLIVSPSTLSGRVRIPGSKSHTIRALICALYANGESIIRNPLHSEDTLSAKRMVESFGAEIIDEGDLWRVHGTGEVTSHVMIDVGNSGTSLYFGMSAAAISDGPITFDGDAHTRRRTAMPLIDALEKLGVKVESSNGRAPITITGPMKGTKTLVHAVSSQYLSSLLLASPLSSHDTEIEVPLLNEKPYIEMTLQWLDRCGIKYEHSNDLSHFFIRGNQKFKTFDCAIPADFSSASFFLAAGALCGGPLVLEGLEYSDVQGDKRVADILAQMGAKVDIQKDSITVQGPLLNGGEFDLNDIPDALPILAVVSCFAPGRTRLYNVEHARIKETDRIAVMHRELNRLGGNVFEMKDGLVILASPLRGGEANGHGDHRVVMSCAVAGCASKNGISVKGADAAMVTFPEFPNLMREAGAVLQEAGIS